MPVRRWARLRIESGLFLQSFQAGRHAAYEVMEGAIPADARIVNVQLAWPASVEVLVESESFESVEESGEIPLIIPSARQV